MIWPQVVELLQCLHGLEMQSGILIWESVSAWFWLLHMTQESVEQSKNPR